MTELRFHDVIFRIEGASAFAVIDRPAAHNALSPSVLAGLNHAMDVATESACSVFVLRGNGGSLSAGADLKYLRGILDDPGLCRRYITSIGTTLDRLETASFASIAVVERYALAGGCEAMLACDLSVVSDDAQIGDRHLEYGLLPGAGGSVRLTHAIPGAVARRLLFTGEIITGQEAARIGLASISAPSDELDATLDGLVRRLERHPFDALTTMKRMHRHAQLTDAPRAHVDEREALLIHLQSQTVTEGLAAFDNHCEPRFASVARHACTAAVPAAREDVTS